MKPMRPGFACNAHCPDRKHVIIQQNCHTTEFLLKETGYIPIPTDTSNLLNRVALFFSMKLMFSKYKKLVSF